MGGDGSTSVDDLTGPLRGTALEASVLGSLDTLERARTIAGLVLQETQRIQGRSVSISRAISGDGTRVEKTVVFEEPDGTEQTVRESVRMYTDEELGAMLRSAGFSSVSFYGSLLGTPYAIGAPRLIAVALKGSD